MTRTTRLLVLIVCLVAIGLVATTIQLVDAPVAPGEKEDWHVLRTGGLARAAVERALYEVPGHPHFFVRVRVTNRLDQSVGLDLRDYWRAFRPNQWGGLSEPRRGEINEERMMPSSDDLRAGGGRELREAFTNGELITIESGRHLDYYVEFNASGREDVDATDTPFLFVSMDGELRLTTDNASEQITLEFGVADPDPEDDLDSDLILTRPFPWRQVPPGALVLESP